jgi:hypothetical protein
LLGLVPQLCAHRTRTHGLAIGQRT